MSKEAVGEEHQHWRKQGYKIELMKKWCREMKINFMPTIFINEYQLPDAYNIEDLQYFLLE